MFLQIYRHINETFTGPLLFYSVTKQGRLQKEIAQQKVLLENVTVAEFF